MDGSTAFVLLIFAGSMILMGVSSVVLTSALNRLGAHGNLGGGALGLITALGANSPELCTAVVALSSRSHDLGVGIILGSNVFNVAMILGICATIAGRAALSQAAMALEGGVACVVAAIALAMVSGAIGAGTGMAMLLVVYVPYVVVLICGPDRVSTILPPGRVARFLARIASPMKREQDAHPPRRTAGWLDWLALLPCLASTVGGSIWLVRAASVLGERWGIADPIMGVLILAALTGIPNLLSGIRLARQGRAAAVASETFNSNSLNVLIGLALPMLVLGHHALTPLTRSVGWWFASATAVGIALLLVCGGLRRWAGVLLIAGYALFATVLVLRS